MKKFIVISMSILLLLATTIGCSTKKIEETNDMAITQTEESKEMIESYEENTSSVEPTKVITTVSLAMQTLEFDNTIKSLDILISKHKSYVETSNINYGKYYNEKNYRVAHYTIRVPKASVDTFLKDSTNIAHIYSQSTSKQDITKHYQDTESRLNVLKIKEERILTLLKKAEKMEDIIALENSLSDIIHEKEGLMGSLKDMDDKVDFNTINISIEEVDKLSNSETIKTTFGEKIKNAIGDSIYSFKVFVENLIIYLIYLIPFALIIGLVGYIVYKIIKAKNSFKK